MTPNIGETNRRLVLAAFDTLFNKRDYAAAEAFWSPRYIQHSAHIPPGRSGLFDWTKAMPPTLHYEVGLVVANLEVVMLHGRFSGTGRPRNWIAAHIVRVDNDLLVEHWDVLQYEVAGNESQSGLPMFGGQFST